MLPMPIIQGTPWLMIREGDDGRGTGGAHRLDGRLGRLSRRCQCSLCSKEAPILLLPASSKAGCLYERVLNLPSLISAAKHRESRSFANRGSQV